MLKKIGCNSAVKSNLGEESSGGPSYLDGILGSVVFEFDATIADSYGGSGQAVANLIASPADGADQSDYDFYLGATGSVTSDDPAFTGSAGDAAAYFAMDGGDFFKIAGGNTAFLDALHKTTGGADFFFVMVYKTPAEDASAEGLFSTQAGNNDIGMRVSILPNETILSRQRGDSSNTTAISTGSVPAETDTIVIISHSHSTNETAIWVNSATAETFSHTYDTTTTDPTGDLLIGYDGYNFEIGSGARVYAVAMGNEYIDNTDAAAIIAEYEARHGRSYAG